MKRLMEKLIHAEQLKFTDLWDQGDRLRVVAVENEGEVDVWTAYIDLAAYSTEHVMKRGWTLNADDATCLFPLLNPARYQSLQFALERGDECPFREQGINQP